MIASRVCFRRLIVIAVLAGFGASAWAAGPAPIEQSSFASPEAAAAALAGALKGNDPAAQQRVLGPGSEKLISSGDRYADQHARDTFLQAYDQQHKLVPQGEGRVTLDVGPNDWPLPIPIVQANGAWHFDSRAGAQEIVDRRIGRNEVAAIRVSLAYVDAQKDYFHRMQQAGPSGGAYAQRLVSTPGRHDGLYWPAAGGAASPLEALVAQAVEEGYPGELVAGHPMPYRGYYFRILTGQGPDASGGAKDYLVDGRMTGGFGLIAWPAVYGSSGIMTFVVNQGGVVFQKDLGRGTPASAAAIRRFDPDLSWARVDIVAQ